MVVNFPCLVCNRTVTKNHRSVQCDVCASWVHIAFNNLNLYTYRKLQKDKSPWCCMCCFRKELPYGSINDTKFRNLLHGETIVSPNPKMISSIVKESEYFGEEVLKKANNKLYTPDEFNNIMKSLNLASQLFCMHLSISSLSYHHLELFNLFFNLKIKPNITGISETRLQMGKQPITNISFPNYVYEHTPTESGKGGTLLYIDKNIKYKLRNDLNIYEKRWLSLLLSKFWIKNRKIW